MGTETHYRKAFNSPYLAAVDVIRPIELTVRYAAIERDLSKRTKDEFVTVHFAEQEIRDGEKLKPMIFNATNCKTMAEIAGSPIIETWAGHKITVHVENDIKFGRDTVSGLRIGLAEARINTKQIEEIQALADSVGVEIERIAASYKVESLDTLPASYFQKIMRKLKAAKQ